MPTTTGSMAPGVYLEEVSLGFREGVLVGAVITSPHDPNVLLGASLDNHLYRSDDNGLTFQEIRLPGLALSFPGDGIQRHYPGALRLSPSPTPHPLLNLRTDSGLLGDAARAARVGENGLGTRARLEELLDPEGRTSTESAAGASRLRALMARAGRPTVGRARVSDTLSQRGAKVSAIWFPEFHPTDPKIVWVLTYDGLYTSTDGGWSFTRTWLGRTPAGSATYWITVDPQDPLHYLLATGEGLYVSHDGGRNYLRHPGQMIGDWVIYSADFHPTDPRYVFAVTDHGLLRSTDRGKTWHLIYWSTHPMGQLSRSFIFDPFDPDRGFLDTNNGLMETNQLRHGGLDSWKHTGGALFTGTYTAATATCPKHPGHMWTMTQLKNRASFFEAEPRVLGNQFIYESLDGGRTWRALFSGQTAGEIGWFVNDDHDPDLLLIFTDQAAFRMRRGPRPHSTPPRRRALTADPPVSEVVEAALRYTGTSVQSELEYRRRATLSALLPRVEATYVNYRTRSYGLFHDALFPNFPFLRDQSVTAQEGEFRLLLSWDLSTLFLNLHASLIGPESQTLDALRMKLMLEIQTAYGRLRRLRALLARVPPEDRRARMAYRLRIEEIQAYLNRMTGGLFEHPAGRP